MLKKLRRAIGPLLYNTDLYIRYQIRTVERIFSYHQDFQINYAKDVVALEFKSSMGYLPNWSYAPRFAWDCGRKAWKVSINGLSFYTITFPLFELINELRGYLLLGDLHTGDTVIDAGASSGISAMYFAKRIGPEGRLICLEPSPDAIKILRENISINALENIAVLEKGISDRSGTESFFLGDVGASHIVQGSSKKSKSAVTLEVVTLDDIVRAYGLEKVDFIKMDIEGAEVRIIDQLSSFLASQPGLIIAVASYHECSERKASAWIHDQIERMNLPLEVKTVYPHHETTFLLNRANINMVRRLREIKPYTG